MKPADKAPGRNPDDALFRDLVENARIAIMIADADGSIRYSNRQFSELFGYSEAELRDRTIQSLVHSEDVERVIENHHARITAGTGWDRYEFQGLRKDGSTVDLEVCAAAMVENGEPVGIRCHIWDVSEKKQMEKTLLRNEATFNSLFRTAPIGMGLVADRVFRFVNDKLCEMTGYRREELLGESARMLYESDEEFDRVGKLKYAEIARTGIGTIETRLKRRDGSSFDSLIRSSSINPEDPSTGVIFTAMDLSERKRSDALQQVLYGILHASTEAADVATLIAEIRDLLASLIDTTNFYVALYDPTTDRYRLPFFADEYDTMDPNETVALPKSLTDYVRRTGEPQFINSEMAAALEAQGEVEVVGTDSPQWLGAPLKSERGIIGVVAVQSYRDPELYTPHDLDLLGYAAGTISTAVERKRAEGALRYRAEFESVITSVSATFIGLSADQVDQGIDDALQTIGEFAQVDRSYVFQFSADGATASNTHEWCAVGISPQIDRLQKLKPSDFPLVLPTLARGKVFHMARIADLPPEATAEKEEFEIEGIRSIVVVPMRGRDRVVGALGFDSVRREGRWTEDTIALLQIAGDVFANALERQRAEQALRDSEERYRLLFERNLAGVFRTTVDGQMLECNQAFARIFGYEIPEEVCQQPAVSFHPDDEAHGRFIAALIDQKTLVTHELPGRRRDGSLVWLLVNASLVSNGNGGSKIIEGTVYDITEQRNTEEQLRQAQKMEAVGQLAGGIAHDFNNLLQSIRMHVDLSAMRKNLDDEVSSHISGIRDDAERAAALTRQLLAFSRRQDLEARSTDLNDLMPQALHMLGRIIGEDIELEFEPAEELPHVSIDPGQIEQVLMNLTLNARDAMPTGGRINISTDVVELDGAFCTAHGLPASGSFVRLKVKDTGCGMEPELLQQIFEPFFTTKEIGKGTGLGLATVYGTVRQHGGTVVVDSEAGKGSTFNVLLPPAGEHVDEGLVVEEQPAPVGSETILVAEDERSVRELVVKTLEGSGYTVVTAADGEEAVRKFREHDGVISLALLDAVMPRLGGREAMERITALDPSIKVLFSTGYASDGLHRRFTLDDSLEVIQKPYSVSALLERVREVLDRD